ncbi:MAG TPA: response regulator [Symbiobacteriaceae bacterium]
MKAIRTLIIEDDAIVADVNRRYVEAVPGFVVTGIAPRGDQALTMVARHHPELVLLDVYMPGLSGLEFLGQLRGQGLAVDVIMATAAAEGDLISQATRMGVVDYLIKPYTRERFTAALERYAAFRRRVHTGVTLGQADLDGLLGPALAASRFGGTPKGIDPLTLERVRGYLAVQQEARSVQEIVAAISLSRITCLRYLSYLIDRGLLVVELSYGDLGRPSKRYRIR